MLILYIGNIKEYTSVSAKVNGLHTAKWCNFHYISYIYHI